MSKRNKVIENFLKDVKYDYFVKGNNTDGDTTVIPDGVLSDLRKALNKSTSHKVSILGNI